MKHKLLSAVLTAALALTSAPIISASEASTEPSVSETANLSTAPTARAVDPLNSETVYNAMIALKDEYPNGMSWTNDDFYAWDAGIYSGGYGCVAFAFILSDAAFDGLPARCYTTFDPSTVRVGDILRNWGHSYIVLEIHEDYFVIAEGNINESILWGREIGFDKVADGFEEHLTRYPITTETTEPTTDTTYPTWGNVNGDEKIDASDAAEVLVAAAAVGSGEASGLTTAQETYADVDESGSFNAADAALILQYATYAGTGGTKALKDYLAELE